jgi:hypothetical protein
MGEQQLELLDVGFFKALMHDDDLGAVVRGQTFIENRLQALVSRNIRHPHLIPWDQGSWNFARLKELAIAMGELSESDAQIINRLAKLRNDFAHKPDMELTSLMVERVYAVLDVQMKSLVDSLRALAKHCSPHSDLLRKVIFVTKMTLDARVETPLYKTTKVARRIRSAVSRVVQASLLDRPATLWD